MKHFRRIKEGVANRFQDRIDRIRTRAMRLSWNTSQQNLSFNIDDLLQCSWNSWMANIGLNGMLLTIPADNGYG